MTCLSVDAMGLPPPPCGTLMWIVSTLNPHRRHPGTGSLSCGIMSPYRPPWTAVWTAWISTVLSRLRWKTPCGWGTLIFEVGIGQAPEVEEILAQNGFEQIRPPPDTRGSGG